MWDLIRWLTKNSHDYDEKYMKTKFHSDDDLPLNKMIKIHNVETADRAVFHENNKFIQIWSDKWQR